jgi:hypothetical protein
MNMHVHLMPHHEADFLWFSVDAGRVSLPVNVIPFCPINGFLLCVPLALDTAGMALC